MEKMAQILVQEAAKVMLSRRFSPQSFQNALEGAFRRYGYREQVLEPTDILFISLNAIGDNVLYSGLVRELRRNYPRSRITVVATPLTCPLWEPCPYINRVLSLQYNVGEDFGAYFPRFAQFCQTQLLPLHFSHSFSPQWSDDKRPLNLLAYMSGAGERYGISDKSILAYYDKFYLIDQWEFFLTEAVVTPTEILHEAARALYMLRPLGGQVVQEESELWVARQAEFFVKEKLGRGDYIVLGLGAGAENRKYPLDKWYQALAEIYEQYRIPFALCGGPGEVVDGKYLQNKLPPGSVINMTAITLQETAAVIKNALLYLGNVTGMMHMAAAAGRPVITLFREAKIRPQAPAGIFSESTRFAPWHTKTIVLQPEKTLAGCSQGVIYGGCHEETAHCIATIPPEEIVQAFRKLVAPL